MGKGCRQWGCQRGPGRYNPDQDSRPWEILRGLQFVAFLGERLLPEGRQELEKNAVGILGGGTQEPDEVRVNVSRMVLVQDIILFLNFAKSWYVRCLVPENHERYQQLVSLSPVLYYSLDISICWSIRIGIFHTFLEISIFEKEYPKYLGSPFPGNWGGILASKDKMCFSFEKFI